MSKAEILAELPKLKAQERKQVFEGLCELQDSDLLRGVGPTAREERLLDEALAEFERDGNPGTPWHKALRRVGPHARRRRSSMAAQGKRSAALGICLKHASAP